MKKRDSKGHQDKKAYRTTKTTPKATMQQDIPRKHSRRRRELDFTKQCTPNHF